MSDDEKRKNPFLFSCARFLFLYLEPSLELDLYCKESVVSKPLPVLQMAPETFRRLAQGEAAMRKAMGGNLGALQCTHPRSETRVQMLEEELGFMKDNEDLALQKVMHKVPYWML